MKLNPAPLHVLVLAGLLSGCATHISTSITQNPPPAERFSNFNRFEMTAIALAPPYAGQGANEKALRKIQEDVSVRMVPALKDWNAAGASGSPARTLLIEPTVTEIKFIGGGARVWAGAMAGSSAVLMTARITEKETGRVVATPLFYARAEAWGGAFTFGVTDNLMLLRIADRLCDYLLANYTEAVGGVTGQDPEKK
jgi:hypothetical protein